MNRLIKILIIVLSFSFVIGQNSKKKKPDSNVIFSNKESKEEYLKILERSIDLLETNYVDSINMSEIILSGVKGLMFTLDPYTKLLRDQSKESYDHLRTGKYGGVGIKIGLRRDTLTVLGTYENSPAYSEGIQVGDNIMMIDSISTKGLTLKESSQMIKGELDSVVSLHIFRSSTKEKIKFDLTRSNIPLKNVPYAGVNEDGIGYIRITRFSKNSDKDFKEGLKKMIEQGLNGLIIDLRGNSGGLLSSAINILDNLTERGDVLLTQKGKRSKSNKEWKSRREPILNKDIPLVILINRKSASASEIVAGTIQDLDRGVVIGQKSFGKGLIQHMFNLNDTTTIKITTAKFYLPSGRLIQKQDYFDDGFLTDGLDKKDTTFTTSGGRFVKGGGGIVPDIVTVPNKYSSFINALWKDKVFLTFAADYAPKNPWLKKRLNKKMLLPNRVIKEFKKFVKYYDLQFTVPGEKEYNKMKDKLVDNPISFNPYSNNSTEVINYKLLNEIEKYFQNVRNTQLSLSSNKKSIENGLLREFTRILYSEEKRIEVSLINDVEYNEALELLTDLKQYNQILSK